MLSSFFLVSPAQMGQQGLLQQVVSLMSNAGANIGAQGSRMLGGQLPEIQERETISQVYQDVKNLGLTNNSEVYTELAKRLADKGLTDKASIASTKALLVCLARRAAAEAAVRLLLSTSFF